VPHGLPGGAEAVMTIQGLTYKLDKSAIPVLVLIVCASVAAGIAFELRPVYPLLGAAGTILFLALVWDFRIIVPLLIVLAPLGPKYPMSFGNLYLATAVVIVAYAAWLWRLPLSRERLAFPREPVLISLVVLVGVMILSSLQSISFLMANKLYLLRFVQFMLYTFFFALVLQMSFSRTAIKTLLALVLAVGLLEGLIGVWQWQTNPGIFVTGTFDYRHTNYSVYIVFITLLFLGVLMESRKIWMGLASMAALAVLLYSVVFSFSRGAYVSLAAGLVTMMFMPVSRRRRLYLLGALALGIVVAVAAVPRDVVFRAQDVLTTLTGDYIALSFASRLRMWRIALADFMQSPILGKGTWNYGLRDNFYFKMLGEVGILGLLAFIAVLLVMMKREWRAVKARAGSDLVRGIATGLLPATVATLVVFELSGDHFLNHRFMISFWVVLGLILKYCLGVGSGERQNE
jgi:O-antigen ligase